MPVNSALSLVPAATGWALATHPLYRQRNKWWELYRISYNGGADYLEPTAYSVEFTQPELATRRSDGTLSPVSVAKEIQTLSYRSLLFRHNREKEWEWYNRSRRARYFNIVKPAVNSCVSHAMKAGVTREGDAALTAFWGAADEDRVCTMDNVMSDALRRANTFGIWWLCVDQAPAPDGDDAPYVYGVSPQDILDWQTDDDGNIEWLKQYVMAEQRRTWEEKYKAVDRVRVWSKTEVIEYEIQNGSPVEQSRRPNQVGRVPFVPVYAERSNEYDFPFGISLVADLSKMANDVFNKASLLDEVLYKQTFAWLIVPDPAGKLDTLQIGVNTAFGYDPGGQGGKPEFISPPPENARVLMESIGTTLEQARNVIGLGRGRSESSKEQASGAALELESEDKRALLADIAREGQDAELRIASLVQTYAGGGGEPPYIAYPRNFDVRGFKAEVDEALSFRSLGLPHPVDVQLKTDLVRRKWQGALPPARLDELVAAVEAQPEAGLDRAPGLDQADRTGPGPNKPGTATAAMKPNGDGRQTKPGGTASDEPRR